MFKKSDAAAAKRGELFKHFKLWLASGKDGECCSHEDGEHSDSTTSTPGPFSGTPQGSQDIHASMDEENESDIMRPYAVTMQLTIITIGIMRSL